MYKRYEIKPGKKPPEGFEPANEIDEVTRKQQGWLPVREGNEDKWHREAFSKGEAYNKVYGSITIYSLLDGTYELIGPKIQGNPEKAKEHILILHGQDILEDCPRDFNGIKEYLQNKDIEGIVWWRPDGRMVKIKRKDFWK